MRTIMIAAVASLIASCASQNTPMTEYKELTKNVDRCNPGEVVLAQALYNQMKPLKKD